MAEITIDHLNALADRIEASVRRDVDTLRAEVKDNVRSVHARVTELSDRVGLQNGRVLKSEERIADVDRQVTALRHDFSGYEAARDSFLALLKQVRGAPLAVGDAIDADAAKKPSKVFVSGVIAAIVVLAGVAQIAIDFIRPIAEAVLRSLK